VRIVALGQGDEDKVEQASGLFDGPACDEATTRFLNDPDHHLLIATRTTGRRGSSPASS
jgi:hypothetical protein